MIQGDEPLVQPRAIEQAIEPMLEDKKILITNLMADIKDEKDYYDPNIIKVVTDNRNYALYFSRSPIPTNKKGVEFIPKKQICIIPFRRDYLI
jgi:3-deoxy-manno-octulosonate cytidylyltransferase (CMP-KDO synthetase)